MANNIKVGPNIMVAKTTASLASIFDEDDVTIVYECDGVYRSWMPDREVNPITQITQNKGYLIIAKALLDREAQFL